MAFIQPPILSSVRRSVAVRLNFGAQAEQSDSMRALVDEFVRRAARELILECQWVELRHRYQIPLIMSQAWYDWPDNMDPGRLERLIVVAKNGEEFRLQAGIHPEERGAALAGRNSTFHADGTPNEDGQYAYVDPDSSPAPADDETRWVSLPLRYEIINQQLCILPLPNTDAYPTLIIEGYMRPVSPKNNDDPIPVDEEALIQKATVIGKMHFNSPDALAAAAYAKEYIDRLRPMQSEGESFRIGGHFSRKFRYNQPRRSERFDGNYWLMP